MGCESWFREERVALIFMINENTLNFTMWGEGEGEGGGTVVNEQKPDVLNIIHLVYFILLLRIKWNLGMCAMWDNP